MRRTKYKHSFDRIVINNRWSQPFWSRSGDWLIFGFAKRWFSHDQYEYQIGLFGITVRIWIKRTFVETPAK